MKKCCLFFLIFIVYMQSFGQNVGIGTDNPVTKLDVSGDFRVTAPYISSLNPPTAAQTITMVNAVTSSIVPGDSTARIYDPGGVTANYPANVTAGFLAERLSGGYIELLIEVVELGTGDSLKIYDGEDEAASLVYEAGNGFAGNNITVNLSASVLYCTFKSNADASVAAGFSLLLKRKFPLGNISPQSVSTGAAAVFYPQKAAFRTGYLKNSIIGSASFASGSGTIASGSFSVALGNQTIASGQAAFAMGGNGFTGSSYVYTKAIAENSVAMGGGCFATGINSVAIGGASIASGHSSIAIGSLGVRGATYSQTRALGTNSTAIGYGPVASGDRSLALGTVNEASGAFSTSIGYNTKSEGSYATAMGYGTIASGSYSTAIGYNIEASGEKSIAMGSYARVSGNGSMYFGDYSSTASSLVYAGTNIMHMRFSNGYKLYTNSTSSTGVSLAAGGSSWSTISDYRKKENFLLADGKSFLQKIGSMQLGSWNYIGQDKNEYRHYGPMAQEFYKHFGNDGYGTIGNDTTIASADIDGVMMIALQALVKENEELKQQNKNMERRLQKLEAILNKQQL